MFMVRLYFDIETYRKEAFKDENIIATGQLRIGRLIKNNRLKMTGN